MERVLTKTNSGSAIVVDPGLTNMCKGFFTGEEDDPVNKIK
jgi:hypothetical protein